MKAMRPRRVATLMPILLITLLAAGRGQARTTLTIADARQRALAFNRMYLSAQEGVVKAQGDVRKARAGALPDVSLSGRYNRNLKLGSMFWTSTDDQGIEKTTEIRFGFKNNFGASLTLQQSIWQGGKVFTALRIARLYGSYTRAQAEQTRADVKYQAEVLFYGAILQGSVLAVLQKSFEAASRNLEVVEKFYSQGLVSEFELLRARVEKSNLMPRILQLESEVRLSDKRLKSFLGIDLNEEVVLMEEPDDTSLAALLPMTLLVDTALGRRPEMRQLDYLTDISKKAISIARADYLPSLAAVSQYDWQSQSDKLTLRENISRSWTAGLVLSVPLFRGGRVGGAVAQAKADYNQTRLASAQMRDDIRLEVEEAYDRIRQAKKALDIQGETIAQAEEGLKIANLRYESGVGTQLEVLSAQAALTEARRVRAEATFFFREAKARLKRATTVDTDEVDDLP
ncbi:MAG TPA: TolC family protein [Acidobacteriota bacterium]|nr:TolC family protein [Acidobacteriota bacterium]